MLCFFILLTICCALVADLMFWTFQCATFSVDPYGILAGCALEDLVPV